MTTGYGKGKIILAVAAVAVFAIFGGGCTDVSSSGGDGVDVSGSDGGSSGAGYEAGANVPETETKTTEEDIVTVTMGSGTYRVDVSPATCDSNLKTISIDVEEFDFHSIDSEGVWFTEKPLVESEKVGIDKGIISAVVVIKRKNLEKFFLEFDGVEFQNIHTDDSSLYVDIKTNKNVLVETYATIEPAKKIVYSGETKSISASKNNLLLAENIHRDNWDFVMLSITVSRYVY